jgi:DUF2934 family protein
MKSKTMTADLKDREHEAVESEQTQLHLASAPSLDEIRHRAYELHLERGCMHGWDQDDWLQAERDLMEKYQTR